MAGGSLHAGWIHPEDGVSPLKRETFTGDKLSRKRGRHKWEHEQRKVGEGRERENI